MKAFILKYVYILVTGSIFYLFSERYFWSFWRSGGEDSVTGTVWGILFYSLAAYAVLFLIDRYKINSKEGLLIVGLLFGFLIEGMMAGMLYTPLLPLVAMIALPWHALVTLFVGWHYLPRVISGMPFREKTMVTLGVAIVWFFWAIGWFVLPTATEYSYTTKNFIVHGLVTTSCLVLVYWVAAWIRSVYEITFKTYEGFLILFLLFLFLGLVHPATIAFSFPLSFVVITVSILLLRRQKYVIDTGAPVFAFPRQVKGMPWLFCIYAITTVGMITAQALNVKLATVYPFAFLFVIATLYLLGKSLKYFLKRNV